eukprot:6279558-Amphidinium_carterae.2
MFDDGFEGLTPVMMVAALQKPEIVQVWQLKHSMKLMLEPMNTSAIGAFGMPCFATPHGQRRPKACGASYVEQLPKDENGSITR